MGKKKGKKSGGKKKGGKKKKNAAPEMTIKEAILAYQINIVEQKIEDVKYEIRGLEEKRKRNLERNDRLKNEQIYYIKHLMEQAKGFEKQLADAEPVDKLQVIETMKLNWETKKTEREEVEEMKLKSLGLDSEIDKEQADVKYWQEYKETGQHAHAKQIERLEKELADMKNSFEEMKAHLHKSLEKTKNEIDVKTESVIDKQKSLASEKAMSGLDKQNRQEVLDNDWLKREAVIHHRVFQEIRASVENLERKNLEIMSELFDCKVQDLKISRNFYLTQFEDEDDLENNGILELDLSKLSLSGSAATTPDKKQRPKSAIQRAVEDKVFSYDKFINKDNEEYSSGSEEEDNVDDDESVTTEQLRTEIDDLMMNYYNIEEEGFQDYLKLGPVELKLLNIAGKKAVLHEQRALTEDEVHMLDYCPEKWPVTQPMIQEIKHESPRKHVLKTS